MKTIRISDEVWRAFEKQGKFGETPDDVLRRVFGVSRNKKRTGSTWTKVATNRMVARVADRELSVRFKSGDAKRWTLPARDDKVAIRKVRDEAVNFAEGVGAVFGQLQAVKKALTDARYYVAK